MKYLKAYLNALAEALKTMGAVYLIISAAEADKAISLFFVYVCVLASLAGPIRVLLEEYEKEKPIV